MKMHPQIVIYRRKYFTAALFSVRSFFHSLSKWIVIIFSCNMMRSLFASFLSYSLSTNILSYGRSAMVSAMITRRRPARRRLVWSTSVPSRLALSPVFVPRCSTRRTMLRRLP
jgi:hypothetical protein